MQKDANLVDQNTRSRKMQKNASLLAIVALHTAENELSKVGDPARDCGE